MFVIVQYVFFDLRLLSRRDTINSILKNWPYPTPDINFIKNFGKVKSARNKSILKELPLDSHYFVHGNNAIKFVGINKIKFKSVIRRLYIRSNGGIDYVIGIEIPKNQSNKKLIKTIEELLRLKVRIDAKELELIHSGASLKNLYAKSTTGEETVNLNKYVQYCSSLLIVDMDNYEKELYQLELKKTNVLGDQFICVKDAKIANKKVRIVFLNKTNRFEEKLLKFHISHTHNAFESIKAIAKWIKNDPSDFDVYYKTVENLYHYLIGKDEQANKIKGLNGFQELYRNEIIKIWPTIPSCEVVKILQKKLKKFRKEYAIKSSGPSGFELEEGIKTAEEELLVAKKRMLRFNYG